MLLDTCALIWIATGSRKLSGATRKAIEAAPDVYVSSISAFEIAYKNVQGGINLPCDPSEWFTKVLTQHDIQEVPLSSDILIKAAQLPLIHKDPCDRFIIATAMLYNLPIVTGDKMFQSYGVAVLV